MFDLIVPVAGGRQTLFVMNRSLRSAALPIEIEIRRRQSGCSGESGPQKTTPPEGGVTCCASERAQSCAISELSRYLVPYFGSNTVSITWITPFEAFTSAVVTLALFTITPTASAFTLSDWPLTVGTMPVFTSLAITAPETTWYVRIAFSLGMSFNSASTVPAGSLANAASVGANSRLRLGSKAEAVAWGQNDHADTADRYPFFCVWRFPDPTMGQAYIDVLSENGWNDYFATESIHGAPKTPFDVMTQHVLL